MAIASKASGGLAFSSGAPAGSAIRTDAPFAGVLYQNGTPINNNMTMASLPTAAAAYLGLVVRVTDACVINGTLSRGLDFECVTYDGSAYYWVPYGTSEWRYSTERGALTRAGTGADDVLSSVTLPNRLDMFPPGVDLVFEHHTIFSTHGTGDVAQCKVFEPSGGATVMNLQIASGGTTGANRIVVRGADTANSQFQIPNSVSSSGYLTSTGATATLTLTLANRQFDWMQSTPATSTLKWLMRDLTIRYP